MITTDLIKAVIKSKTVILIEGQHQPSTGRRKRLSYDTLNDNFIVETDEGTIFEKDMNEAATLYNNWEV